MKKIIILDFSDGEVYIKDYNDSMWSSHEDFLKNNGFRDKDCQWMIVDELKLNID